MVQLVVVTISVLHRLALEQVPRLVRVVQVAVEVRHGRHSLLSESQNQEVLLSRVGDLNRASEHPLLYPYLPLELEPLGWKAA